MPSATIREGWPTWEWQVEATRAFYSAPVTGLRRFVHVINRQHGKTALAEALLLREAREKPGNYAFFAPTYDRSEEVYTELCIALADLIQEKLVVPKATKAGWVLRFSPKYTKGGKHAAIHLKSLANPEHLRGQTLRGMVIDEAGYVVGTTWRQVLQPMLLQLDGWAWFIGTPPDPESCNDPHFFKTIAERAGLHFVRNENGERECIKGPAEPRWWGIHRDYTRIPNQRVVREIEAEKEHTPTEEFDREYRALFTDDQVFRLPPLRFWGPNSDIKALPDGLVVSTGVDLADNEQELGDKAATVTWGTAAGGYVYVFGGEYYRNPGEVLDSLYAHRALYHTSRIRLQKSSFDKGFRFTVQAAEPTRGFLPVELTTIGGSSKRRRILQMEPIARAGKLIVHEDFREFMKEWESFPDGLIGPRKRNRMTHHYDILDAASPMVEDAMTFSTWVPKEEPAPNSAAALSKALRMRAKGIGSHRIQDTYRF